MSRKGGGQSRKPKKRGAPSPAQPVSKPAPTQPQWRKPDLFSVVLGVAPGVLLYVFPHAPLWVKVALLEVVLCSLVHVIFVAPPWFRRASVNRVVITHTVVAISAFYPLWIAVARWSPEDQPRFTATIRCALLGKNLQAMMDNSPLLEGNLWATIENFGSQDSALTDWSLEIRARDGSPLRAVIVTHPGDTVVFDPTAQPDVQVFAKDTQVGDRLYLDPIKSGAGNFGSINFAIPNAPKMRLVDLSSMLLRFRDIRTGHPWESVPFDGTPCTFKRHFPGEPMPLTPTPHPKSVPNPKPRTMSKVEQKRLHDAIERWFRGDY